MRLESLSSLWCWLREPSPARLVHRACLSKSLHYVIKQLADELKQDDFVGYITCRSATDPAKIPGVTVWFFLQHPGMRDIHHWWYNCWDKLQEHVKRRARRAAGLHLAEGGGKIVDRAHVPYRFQGPAHPFHEGYVFLHFFNERFYTPELLHTYIGNKILVAE